MVSQNQQIISSHELHKNGGKIHSRFWNQEIQELKGKFGKPKYWERTLTWLSVWTSWAEIKNFKTNFLAYAKQLDEYKHMGLDDWISQVVV